MQGDHLVSGFTFVSSASDGNFPDTGGLFHRDVRHLSTLGVSVSDTDMSFLGDDRPQPWHRTLTFAEAVPTVNDVNEEDWDAGTLVLERTQRVHDGYRERIEVRNRSTAARSVSVDVRLDADFADIFELRGTAVTIDRTVKREVEQGTNTIRYAYAYDDDEGRRRERSTRIEFSEPPVDVDTDGARFTWELGAQGSGSVDVLVRPGVRGPGTEHGSRHGPLGGVDGSDPDPGGAADRSVAPAPISPLFQGGEIPIDTGCRAYDRSIAQAAAELRALSARTAVGTVPVAGVPWFDTVFGRDSLLTAYLAMPVAPTLAVGTLQYLARYQGSTVDPDRDERPGKMFHELRFGELARAGAVPHSPYFGSIDATPLWLVLLHELYAWTGDTSVVARLWDPLEAALGWLDAAVDRTGDDPFLYYTTTEQTGVYHKNWRDSSGSLRRSDGTEPRSPVASAEVQGYVYDALTRIASLMRALDEAGIDPSPADAVGLGSRADALGRRAARLQERFHEAFWLPSEGYYAAALAGADREKVESVTSNVGQCLWSGIVPDARADDVIDTLHAPEMFSGWGIRTVSAADPAFHPVSYHRGSVWPHDTALAGLGLARYGAHEVAESVATGLLDASTAFHRSSLPEVFCGFDAPRQPVSHPTGCSPQAWAAAAPFGVLRAAYDLRPGEGSGPTVTATPAALAPDALDAIEAAWAPSGEFGSVDTWGAARGGGDSDASDVGHGRTEDRPTGGERSR